MKKTVYCLIGPTASGKTRLAIELVRHLPLEIISVDSAMVYRGMNIGTAKPTADMLQIAPHRLIDIRDPKDAYSAAQFCADALREIADIFAHGKTPLLVGGTMLYFRALQQGLSLLPSADATLRQALTAEAEQNGWPALHARLTVLDPAAALRIHPHDSQRIQRALEVYQLTGTSLTAWQQQEKNLSDYHLVNIAILPTNRALLHDRIQQRFLQMLAEGFIEEVQTLFARGDLSIELPALRSVGYRQAWEYLLGHYTFDEMREKSIIATRQFAKRQLTWLRHWPEIVEFDSEDGKIFEKVLKVLGRYLA